ncbi:MAG: hypothetical protein HY287_06490 [Planctomycetes bacterium]|nr:hypothetical protein [Planctomycetota bacterium]MBI3833961.1 hypothetical protein [Planctomycetota bacterium]
MQPKPQLRDSFELFQSHFDQLLNPRHELIRLARKISWERFEAAFAGQYSPDMGAPGKATRLMVGFRSSGTLRIKATFSGTTNLV